MRVGHFGHSSPVGHRLGGGTKRTGTRGQSVCGSEYRTTPQLALYARPILHCSSPSISVWKSRIGPAVCCRSYLFATRNEARAPATLPVRSGGNRAAGHTSLRKALPAQVRRTPVRDENSRSLDLPKLGAG